MIYRLEVTETSLSLIGKIPDKRIQSVIIKRIEGLKTDPEKQGKRLVKDLIDFR